MKDSETSALCAKDDIELLQGTHISPGDALVKLKNGEPMWVLMVSGCITPNIHLYTFGFSRDGVKRLDCAENMFDWGVVAHDTLDFALFKDCGDDNNRHVFYSPDNIRDVATDMEALSCLGYCTTDIDELSRLHGAGMLGLNSIIAMRDRLTSEITLFKNSMDLERKEWDEKLDQYMLGLTRLIDLTKDLETD